MPASKRAEGSAKGYFSRRRNTYGRQLVCISATDYREIIASLTDVFKLLPPHQSGSHGQRGVPPLQDLNSTLLVGADQVYPCLVQCLVLSIQFTHRRHLLSERFRVFGTGVEPISASMGLQLRLILKKTPHTARRNALDDVSLDRFFG